MTKKFNIKINGKSTTYRMPEYFYNKFSIILKYDDNQIKSLLTLLIDEHSEFENTLRYSNNNLNESINEIIFNKIIELSIKFSQQPTLL